MLLPFIFHFSFENFMNSTSSAQLVVTAFLLLLLFSLAFFSSSIPILKPFFFNVIISSSIVFAYYQRITDLVVKPACLSLCQMNGQEIKKGERNARLTEVSQSVIKRIYCQTFNKRRCRIIIYRFSFGGYLKEREKERQ